MRFFAFMLASVVLLSAAATAPAQAPGPEHQPAVLSLQVYKVEEWSKDKETVTLSVLKAEFQNVTKEVPDEIIDNGVKKIVVKSITYQVTVPKKVVSQWHMTTIKATDVEGKPLSKEELFQRLQPGMPVLVMQSYQQFSPAHRRLFSKSPVILVLTPKPLPPS